MSTGLGGRRAQRAARYLPSLGFIALAFAGCSDQETPLEARPPLAEAAAPAFASARVIPGSYIVVFKPGVADALGLARKLTTENGGTSRFAYSHAIKGFAADLPARAVEALQHNPNVADDFAALILQMLAKKKEDRPKDFHEVLMALRSVRMFKTAPPPSEKK